MKSFYSEVSLGSLQEAITKLPLQFRMTQKFRVGDLVEVRSKEEIFKSLNKKGQLDGLPFMPEMFAFCGKRFRVYKRAHKTCDTVFPVRGRKMVNAVHLDLRCDGKAHGGCQAGCLIFWKEVWLKRVEGSRQVTEGKTVARRTELDSNNGCAEQDVWAGTRGPDQEDQRGPAYICQATQLPYATTALRWWDMRQYLEDYISGNVGLWRIVKGLIYASYYQLSIAGLGVGRIMRWLYDRFCPILGGTPFPRKTGTIPMGEPTPKLTRPLDLQPGELVRVRSHEHILKTLNTQSKNQGLYFDAEMVPYCGRIFRVLKRVSHIIDEKSGQLMRLQNEAIVLDGVICEARYSHCRMFCPRAIYPYWREIWLERANDDASAEQARSTQRLA